MKKNTLNRILSMALSFCMVLSLVIPAFAADYEDDGFDTLSISMDDYYASTAPNATLLHAISKDNAVRKACEAFIAAGRASVRSSQYSVASLSDANKNQVEYRQSEYEYLSALYKAENVTILRDNMKFSDFDADVGSKTATASIVEKYTYYTDDFDGFNYRMRKYTFSLDKQRDGRWLITGVRTDDPWETSDFSYEPYRVADIATTFNRSIPTDINGITYRLGEKARDNAVALQKNGLYKWTYNTSAAVEYAEHFFNASASSGYNTLFPYLTDSEGNEVNCQNFASQCVWAGLIGDCSTALAMSIRNTLPAVSASRVGRNAINVWCYNDTSSAPEIMGCSWYSSTRFAKMIKLSTTIKEGPFGNTHYGNLRYADVGDVIHINWSHAVVTQTTTLNHAMFVTGATGRVGSRSVSNLKIAANSSPTNSAYESLAVYAKGYDDTSFSTSVIDSGYYSTQRNFR